MYCIKDNEGKLLEFTLSHDDSSPWNNLINYATSPQDDQFSWLKQQYEDDGYKVAIVKLVEEI